MLKITVGIAGMMCGMCEAHTNEAINKAFKVSKVVSSHEDNQTIIITKFDIDDDQIKAAVENAGYTVLSIKRENYEEKKGFLSKFKK